MDNTIEKDRQKLISLVQNLNDTEVKRTLKILENRQERLETYPFIMTFEIDDENNNFMEWYEWDGTKFKVYGGQTFEDILPLNDVIIIPGSWDFYGSSDSELYKFISNDNSLSTMKPKNRPGKYTVIKMGSSKHSIMFQFIDNNGNLFCIDSSNGYIIKISPEGEDEILMMGKEIHKILKLGQDKFIVIYEEYYGTVKSQKFPEVYSCINLNKIGEISKDSYSFYDTHKISSNVFATGIKEDDKTYNPEVIIWKCEISERTIIYTPITRISGSILSVLSDNTFIVKPVVTDTYFIYTKEKRSSERNPKFHIIQTYRYIDGIIPLSDDFSLFNGYINKLGKQYYRVGKFGNFIRAMKSGREDLKRISNILSERLNISSDLAGVISEYVQTNVVGYINY